MFDEEKNIQQGENPADNPVKQNTEKFNNGNFYNAPPQQYQPPYGQQYQSPIQQNPYYQGFYQPKVVYVPVPTPSKPITKEETERKRIRKTANVIGFSFLTFEVLLYAISIILHVVLALIGLDSNKTYQFLNDPIIMQIQQIVISSFLFTIPFIVIFKIGKFRISDLISFKKPLKGSFFPFFMLGIAGCSFANIVVSQIGSFFDMFGIEYSVDFGENPTGVYGFLLSFIATAIVPALVEEFACRGIVLGSLRKHGEGMAIFVSALLFGLMHANFEQIPFAFILGLVFGYITVRSGSIWIAVLLHFYNNAVSVIFSYASMAVSETIINIVYTLFLVLMLILGGISFAFAQNRDELLKLENTDTKNGFWKKTFSALLSVPIIIVSVKFLLDACQYFK